MQQYCSNCGKPLEAGARFCVGCGAAVAAPDPRIPAGQTPLAPTGRVPAASAPMPAAPAAGSAASKSRVSVKMILGLAVLALVLFGAGILGVMSLQSAKLDKEYQALREEIRDCGNPELLLAADAQAARWESTGFFRLSDRQEIVDELSRIAGMAGQTDTAGPDQPGGEILATEPAQSRPDASEAPADPVTEEDDTEAPPEPAAALSMEIQQVDVRNYPEISLYMRVEDVLTGEVPPNLDGTMFFIEKKDANGDYIRQTVTEVSQLNELEMLNVVMVADVSGSMAGDPMEEARDVMTSFLQSVQFSAGDQVALIAFSTGVRLVREFTDNQSELIRDVQNLYTDNMTALYDALYTAVCQAAAQPGAKCVMAFTDGLDNYSNCTVDRVIETAQRYNVPIFIIGIGEVDTYALMEICSQTGGRYYDVSSVNDMGSLYDEIYRQEKEMYMVRFTDTTGAEATDPAEIRAAYSSPEYEGSCDYSYEPYVLLNVEDDGFYTTGPEHVVECFIKDFADARTYGDFSYIEPYLQYNSEIYLGFRDFVAKPVGLRLESYEIVSTEYQDTSHCIVTTYETYYVQGDTTLILHTQRCRYCLEDGYQGWQMTRFAENVEVISQIKQ